MTKQNLPRSATPRIDIGQIVASGNSGQVPTIQGNRLVFAQPTSGWPLPISVSSVESAESIGGAVVVALGIVGNYTVDYHSTFSCTVLSPNKDDQAVISGAYTEGETWEFSFGENWMWLATGPGNIYVSEISMSRDSNARYAVSFNGSSSDIDLGNAGTLGAIIVNRALTVDGWIKLGELSYFGSGVIVSKVRDSNIYCLLFDASNLGDYQLRGSLSTVTGFDEPISTAVFPSAVDVWHHVLMTYDDVGDRKVYLAIDGVWIDTYTNQSAAVGDLREESDANIGLGRQMFGGSWFNGDVAWIRISNNVRYATGVDFTPPDRCNPPAVDGNTLELLKLDEGSGNAANASVSASNNGTITNCTWQECI